MKKPTNKIAIMFGGQSSEHEPTRITFEFLLNRIKDKGLRTDLELSHIIYVTKTGTAVATNYDPKKSASEYEKGEEISLLEAYQIIKDNNLFLFGILYGQNGEDGVSQGVAKLLSIKSNLGSVFSCAIGMSKYHLNKYVHANFPTIKVPETIGVRNIANLEKQLKIFEGQEVVVKPSGLGSSVLTEKFEYSKKTFSEVKAIIEQILELDSIALIQKYIKGTEYSIACLEKDEDVLVLPAIRIETKHNFFGQREKYIAGYSKEIVIKEKDESKLLKQAKKTAKDIYLDLNYQNAVRFDVIISDNEIYFLEINPLPGMLRNSILPRLLRTQGWDLEDLVAVTFDNANNRRTIGTDFFFQVDY